MTTETAARPGAGRRAWGVFWPYEAEFSATHAHRRTTDGVLVFMAAPFSSSSSFCRMAGTHIELGIGMLQVLGGLAVLDEVGRLLEGGLQ